MNEFRATKNESVTLSAFPPCICLELVETDAMILLFVILSIQMYCLANVSL